MRNLREIDHLRDTSDSVRKFFGDVGDHTCGVFTVLSDIDRQPMRAIASSDMGWDRVSVSRHNRCPNWPEMCQVKALFFAPDETALQFHVPESDHVNNHPYCLHLWRPQRGEIVRPPSIMVGIKALGTLKGEAI